ncbi:MAG: serine/threonine-protein kinase [Actinomycetota bacterium]
MTSTQPTPGMSIGDRYELIAHIATGGMGEVWSARDEVLDREVAVKVLHRSYAEDQTFIDRFRGEARNAAALTHPGIAQVYDYGEKDGLAYLVMELVPGEPLSAWLARDGSLEPEAMISVVRQAADALHAAHDIGLIHRDVKPGNLLIRPDGTVKITDFGIARAGGQVPLTRPGEVMGTAQYLAPEQALGRPATPLADVYALGVVAFEAVVGHRPFEGDTPVITALAHVNDPVPPLPDTIPPAIRSVIMRTLAKDPSERPASAAALSEALAVAWDRPYDVTDEDATASSWSAWEPTTSAPFRIPMNEPPGLGSGPLTHAPMTGLTRDAERVERPADRRRRRLVLAVLATILAGGATTGALAILRPSEPANAERPDVIVIPTSSSADSSPVSVRTSPSSTASRTTRQTNQTKPTSEPQPTTPKATMKTTPPAQPSTSTVTLTVTTTPTTTATVITSPTPSETPSDSPTGRS